MFDREHYLWVEKYRPSSLSTYIGNEHLKDKVRIYLESEDVPHLLLYGKAGTGKTTLAKIITGNIDCDHLYINASDENNVDNVRNKIKGFASSVGFKPIKIIIVSPDARPSNPSNQLIEFVIPHIHIKVIKILNIFGKSILFNEKTPLPAKLIE